MPRNPALAKIHIAKKELGMDDDTYRAMLQQHGGVNSAKDLTPLGAAKVLHHLENAGFKPKAGHGKRPTPAANRAALVGKIEALLAEAGLPWAYADGVTKRLFASTTKVERIQFCDVESLRKVVAALSIDARRRRDKKDSKE